jgi:hypothetical protein
MEGRRRDKEGRRVCERDGLRRGEQGEPGEPGCTLAAQRAIEVDLERRRTRAGGEGRGIEGDFF